MKKLFVEVKNGGKMTYSVSDLNKLDRMYETEVFAEKFSGTGQRLCF